MLKNTNESAKVVPSSTCVVAPTFSYNLLDSSQLPYLTAIGPALSYVPFTTGAPAGAAATHLAMPLHAATAPLIADYNAAAAAAATGAVGAGVDPAYSYSNTSSFTVAASPCLPMFFSSETSFQLSTSPCPSDASLTASQVNHSPTLCICSVDACRYFLGRATIAESSYVSPLCLFNHQQSNRSEI